MAKQRSSFAKLQRDKAKKERAAVKRADRADRKTADPDDDDRPMSELVASMAGDGKYAGLNVRLMLMMSAPLSTAK